MKWSCDLKSGNITSLATDAVKPNLYRKFEFGGITSPPKGNIDFFRGVTLPKYTYTYKYK